MKRINLLLLTFLVGTMVASAQIADPVHFSTKLNQLGDDMAEIVFSATIDPGWHVYSTDITDDGPTKATFNVDNKDGVELVGQLTPRGKVTEQFDEMFGTNLRFFENKGSFVQKIRFTKPEYSIDCYLEYGACNDEMCMPPTTVQFKQSGKSPVVAAEAKDEVPQETAAEEEVAAVDTMQADTVSVAAVAPTSVEAGDLWVATTPPRCRGGRFS